MLSSLTLNIQTGNSILIVAVRCTTVLHGKHSTAFLKQQMTIKSMFKRHFNQTNLTLKSSTCYDHDKISSSISGRTGNLLLFFLLLLFRCKEVIGKGTKCKSLFSPKENIVNDGENVMSPLFKIENIYNRRRKVKWLTITIPLVTDMKQQIAKRNRMNLQSTNETWNILQLCIIFDRNW